MTLLVFSAHSKRRILYLAALAVFSSKKLSVQWKLRFRRFLESGNTTVGLNVVAGTADEVAVAANLWVSSPGGLCDGRFAGAVVAAVVCALAAGAGAASGLEWSS